MTFVLRSALPLHQVDVGLGSKLIFNRNANKFVWTTLKNENREN